MRNIRPFGERIAMEMVEESYDGRIALPKNRSSDFFIGRCMAMGDGTYPDGTKKTMWTNVNEVYMFQLDASHRVNATFKVDGKVILMLHQVDMIAKLTNQRVSFDTMEMVGTWVLVKPFIAKDPGSRIVVPDRVVETSPEMQQFTLVKKGNGVSLKMDVGDEVCAARGRVTPINLDGVQYGFIPENFVYGVIPVPVIVSAC